MLYDNTVAVLGQCLDQKVATDSRAQAVLGLLGPERLRHICNELHSDHEFDQEFKLTISGA